MARARIRRSVARMPSSLIARIAALRTRATTSCSASATTRRCCGCRRAAAGRRHRHAQRRRAFSRNTAPADIGWKSLAVNLSDLAAMGAQPAWCTLSLSLPRRDRRGWTLPRRLPVAGGATRRRAGRRRHHARTAVDLRDGAWLRRRGAALRRERRAGQRRSLGHRHARRRGGGAVAMARGRAAEPASARTARSADAARRSSAGRWRTSRMRASTCPTACSPTSATSAWPAASAREVDVDALPASASLRAMFTGEARHVCRPRAATTTNCAFPAPGWAAKRSPLAPDRAIAPDAASVASWRGRACAAGGFAVRGEPWRLATCTIRRRGLGGGIDG